jgi:uncharacterized membrane protein
MLEPAKRINVGDAERLVSGIVGAALTALGLSRALGRRSLFGLVMAGVGGGLLYRGLSGHCHVYAALGIRHPVGLGTATGNLGVKIDRSVTVNAPADQVYRFWRNFENLPRVMSNLERVQIAGGNGNRSRWTVKAPAGMKIEWEAEILNDKPGELIAWRSLPNAMLDHAGSVHFERAPQGGGTIVRVSLQYDPPGGEIGHAISSLFGEDAGRQVEEDLARFKQAMETGGLATK